MVNTFALGVGIVEAVGLGSAYALLALSFTTIFAATGYLHFALGNIVMLGTVVEFWAASRGHLSILEAVVLVILMGATVGWLSDRISVRPTWNRTKNAANVVLLSTMGLAFVIQGLTVIALGPATYQVPPYISPRPFFIDGIPIDPSYVVMLCVLIVVAVVAQLIIRYTQMGYVLRATEENHELGTALGINVRLVVGLVFTVGGAMAALAGYLIAPVSSASANSGLSLLVAGSAAMVIGGFGSFSGAVLGGMIVGAITGLGPLFLPPSAVEPAVLLVMIVILLIRPQGLGLNRASVRRV
jgi:branched-chain amino acid transport system permease protein